MALHEIGHALGLNDNADVNSVMYYGSSSSNHQLDATDVANAEILYGAPTASTVTPPSGSTSTVPTASVAKDSPLTAAAIPQAASSPSVPAPAEMDGAVNQLIQSVAAFKGGSSAITSRPQLLSDEHASPHLATNYRLSA